MDLTLRCIHKLTHQGATPDMRQRMISTIELFIMQAQDKIIRPPKYDKISEFVSWIDSLS